LPKAQLADEDYIPVVDGLKPLQYMLDVMNDPKIDPTRRDRMAIAAAPYCHPRISDRRVTMKEQRATAAQTASTDTEWEIDLNLGAKPIQ
jgi:hypothetical protein